MVLKWPKCSPIWSIIAGHLSRTCPMAGRKTTASAPAPHRQETSSETSEARTLATRLAPAGQPAARARSSASSPSRAAGTRPRRSTARTAAPGTARGQAAQPAEISRSSCAANVIARCARRRNAGSTLGSSARGGSADSASVMPFIPPECPARFYRGRSSVQARAPRRARHRRGWSAMQSLRRARSRAAPAAWRLRR